MRHLKLLSLAGLTVISTLFAGAATSSATVLCKTTATPCESVYGKEAVIKATMSGTAVLTNTEARVLDKCPGGSLEARVTQAGGGELEVIGSVSTGSLTWSECSTTTNSLAGGELSIKHIAGTDNGTVTAKGFEVTVVQGSISCTYTAGTGISLGVIRGRANRTIEIHAVVNKAAGSFECPADAFWMANYKLAEPLYVEPGDSSAWCKTTTSPCGSAYEAGTEFKASVSESVFESLGGSLESTCTGGTVSGELMTDGSELESVSVPLESLTWSGCTHGVASVRAGELDFTPIAGTDNATVSYTGTEVTYLLSGIVTCGYGGYGGTIGILRGAKNPP